MIPMQEIGFPIHIPFVPKEEDPIRLLFEVTEGSDYIELYNTYSTLGKNTAIVPFILFRILRYDYMNKLYLSRDIEKVYNRDINFMCLFQ